MFPYVFSDPTPTKVGRPGQCQNGVDVYGYWALGSSLVGIQCKRMDELDENNEPLPGGALTRKILFEEYEKALAFRPELKRWILATTTKRDAAMQEEARKLSQHSMGSGKFSVATWFWDDYVTFLNNYDKLTQLYYSSVLQLRTPQDEDIAILELFRTAFCRAAFDTPFDRENADHFYQAIKDTQKAVNTGELVDRETRHVMRQVVGGWHELNDENLRLACRKVSEGLKKLRSEVDDGIANGTIIKLPHGQMDVIDHGTKRSLETTRQSCIDQLNSVLSDARMTLI